MQRVLQKPGALFLNIGDTYQEKHLMMVPARLALALQNRGWILHNELIWEKPNALPESIKHRFQSSTERVYFFTKSHKYTFDMDQIRVPYAETDRNNAIVDRAPRHY